VGTMGTVGTEGQKTSKINGFGVPTSIPTEDWMCEQVDRKEYLEWCRDCAVLPDGLYGTKKQVSQDRIVYFEGLAYYPQSYILNFDKNGQAVHSAVLHDLKANSVTQCPLEKVEKERRTKT